MFKQYYNVLGVMSGTSLDGLDIAHIHFYLEENKWQYTILNCATIPYTEDWILRLKNAVNYSDLELKKLDIEYTTLLASRIVDFISTYKIENLDAVCSHGHTILHQPQNGYTLQIGNLPEIASLTNQKVVCNFRVQDVALGGQGAPLVPIGDQILFSKYDYCLNLGGFSNISYQENGKRLAFDICAVNTVLNHYAYKLGYNYDDKGNIARKGTICNDLLEELNQLEYYQKSPPKSLGVESVKTIILPIIETYSISTEDILRTFVEHIAIQIGASLKEKKGSLFISGGGAYHDFLVERMQFHLPNVSIIIPDVKTIEFKEALIFGLLGVLKLENKINVLASVTGAKQDHSSGVVFEI